MSKIMLTGYILVPDGDLAIVEQELPTHIDTTRRESGCLVFEVSRDKNNKNRFNVYEEFIDRTAFEHHQQRVKNSKWGKITANIERHYTISE